MNHTPSLSFRLALLLLPSLILACSGEEIPSSEVTETENVTGSGQAAPTVLEAVQPAPDDVALPAARDSSIRFSAQNVNFGSQTDLDVNRTLVAFDQTALLASVGAQDFVVSAWLELTLINNSVRRSQPAKQVSAHRLLKHWTEDGATWNCAIDSNPGNRREDCSGATKWSMGILPPNPFAVPASATTTIAPQQTGVISFDVTADVKGFLAGSQPNHGWMLRSGFLGELAEFASRETGTPPRLIAHRPPVQPHRVRRRQRLYRRQLRQRGQMRERARRRRHRLRRRQHVHGRRSVRRRRVHTRRHQHLRSATGGDQRDRIERRQPG